MEQQEIAKMMTMSAEEAITIASREFDIDLDGTPESLIHIDKMLMQYALTHKQQAFSDEHIFTICNLMGGYIGDVFINNAGGEWVYDDSKEDEPFVAVGFNGKTFAFPGICYQKLIVDQTVSVQRYYQLAVDGVTQ